MVLVVEKYRLSMAPMGEETRLKIQKPNFVFKKVLAGTGHSIQMIILTGILLLAANAGAFDLRIDGDRLSLRAEKVPLHDILQRVAGHGIVVRIDPQLNPTISAAFENRNLEEGLKSILTSLNHVFFWKSSNEGNDSTIEKKLILSKIYIFSPGQEDRLKPLLPKKEAVFAPLPVPETHVVIKNDKVFVPVVLGYGDGEIETILLFDTGAGSLVLHSDVAQALGIDDATASKGFGVGGMEIKTMTTHLTQVRVGPHTKTDLRVDIVDYQGPPDPSYNGLLGMNFLKGLNYTIDFERQVIVWHP